MAPKSDVNSWEARAERKRNELASTIPKEWHIPADVLSTLRTPLEANKNDLIELDIVRRSGILTERELDITENHNVASLLQRLASGEFTCVEVTAAFSKRAAIAQQLTNCLTETMFEQAKTRAQELDSLRESGKLAGPLHGLPISIKDTFEVKGTQATIGLVAYLDYYSQHNSCLVEILLSLGAVLYVKTNIPQTMMTADSHNNVFGRVLNPHNTMLGAGGSSGGEGALVAFRGSPLGVGTDIGGSIRIPAICCGTYGFKPTVGRVPYGAQRGCSDPGLKFIKACAGPLTNDFEALELFAKAAIGAEPAKYDSTALDIPWRSLSLDPKQKLRLGVLAEDPNYPWHPPVRAIISKATQKLKERGYELVRLDPAECHISDANEIAWGLFSLDQTAAGIVSSAQEPDIPSRIRIKSDFAKVKASFAPEARELEGLAKLSLLSRKRAEILENWRKLWNRHQLDAVIGPGAQNTAVEHDMYGVPPYTTFLNLLDYPACIIPFGKAEEFPDSSFKIESHQAGPDYNSSVVSGMPGSIQVFTSSLRDEECLFYAKLVDQCLN